jgi:hypothetical protein
MTTAIETAFRAFGAWLNEQGIDPKEINLVIRCKDELTRSRLNMALARWQEGLTLYQPTPSDVALKTSPFQCYGMKVNVSSLDASR